MRDAFVQTLADLAASDPSLMLITGDLGFGVLDEYRERFDDQFLNVGVAEQNLAGVAAGLALTGHRVVIYSIGNFPTLRCLEQLRNDVCYHDANVVVVSVGGGMAYGALGPSHFALEDLAIMRVLPGMKVVAPGDPHEVRALLPQLVALGGPAYVRLGRAGEPSVHASRTKIDFGRPAVIRRGEQLCVLASGGMLAVAAEAVETLVGQNRYHPTLVSVHTLAGLDLDLLAAVWEEHEVIVTCEEHSVVGGLGGLVAECVAERAGGPRLVRMGLAPGFPPGIGSQEYLRTLNLLDAPALARRIAEAVECVKT